MRLLSVSRRLTWCLAAVLCVTAPLRGQQAGTPALTVAGDVTTPLSIAPAELKNFPRKQLEVTQEGRTLKYEGVLVVEVLKRAGVPLGGDLRGSALSIYVLATATDGYQVVFSLGELDPAMSNNEVLIADAIDGQPLAATQGPLRIVVPKDARAARSVRMLTRLDVVRLKK